MTHRRIACVAAVAGFASFLVLSERAEAQCVSFGYSSVSPVYVAPAPVVVAPAPVYRVPVVRSYHYPVYRSYSYGYLPVYRSYRHYPSHRKVYHHYPRHHGRSFHVGFRYSHY